MSASRPVPGRFTVLYFAAATSYTRRSHDVFPAPLKVSLLFAQLEQQYPGMKEKVLDSCALTVNLEYVDLEEEVEKKDEELVLKEGDEVAIIPPVSSG